MKTIEQSWSEAPRYRPAPPSRSHAMKSYSRRTITISVATASALVLGGGVAYAYWSAAGSGSGAAKSKSAVALVVTGVIPAAGDLYPGSSAGAVSFNIQNGNPYNVNVTKLTSATVVSDDTANCPTANVSISAGAIPGGGLTVNYTINSNATSATQTISNLLTMAAGAPDGCQGKTFTATLNFTGSQV